MFDGILPHCSTRVDKVKPGMKRVIVGINLFDQKIGPRVSLCSIHTRAFKRAEKLRSTMNSVMSLAGLGSAAQGLGKYGTVPEKSQQQEGSGGGGDGKPKGGLDLASLGERLRGMDKGSSQYKFLARSDSFFWGG